MQHVRVAHTSSMKIIAGECSRARLNSWLTSFSLSPIHLETRSLEDTVKKVDSASVATACKTRFHDLRAHKEQLLCNADHAVEQVCHTKNKTNKHM